MKEIVGVLIEKKKRRGIGGWDEKKILNDGKEDTRARKR